MRSRFAIVHSPGPLVPVTVGLGVVTVGLAILAAIVADHGQAWVVAAVVSLICLAAAMAVVPVHQLPVLALVVTLLVPTSSSLLPSSVQNTAIGVIPLAVWLIRSPKGTARRWLPYCAGAALIVWCMLSELAAPLHTRRGVEWLVTLVICIAVPVMRQSPVEVEQLRRWILRIATPIACYAIAEAFLLHRNALFAFLFQHASWWHEQQQSISYRATTLFGHPLVNGIIFAVVGTLAAAEFVKRVDSPWWNLTRFGILVGAVLATHSRGPAVALGVGIILVIVFNRSKIERTGVRRAILLFGAMLAAAVIVLGLKARDTSAAGQQSAAVRVTVVNEALQAVRGVEPFGAGPGQSEAYRVAQRLPGTGTTSHPLPLENGYAELLVSLGPGGVVLFVLPILAVALPGLRRPGLVGEAAALLTLLVALAGFNAVEGFPPVLVLAALLMLPLAARGAPPEAIPPAARRYHG